MDNLKIWIISLCGATVISSILKNLIGDSSLKKIVNIFLSLFVLLYTIIPVQKVLTDLDFETLTFEKNESIYADGYDRLIRESIIDECEKNSVTLNDIEIKAHIDDDYNYVIEEIVININDDSKIDIVKEEIKKNLNFEVNVI